MTDPDNIELPPMPKPDTQYITHSDFALREYGRKCYEAGLAAARAEPAQPAKPKVHEARVVLTRNGYAWAPDGVAPPVTSLGSIVATLCWTDDGRVWIDSEKNRELAAELRRIIPVAVRAHIDLDALDGGVR